MIKKGIALLLAILIGVWCCACEQHSVQSTDNRRTTLDSSEETAASEPITSPSSAVSSEPSDSQQGTVDSPDVPKTSTEPKDDTNIDVDLTVLSSTMVYSEVYNMLLTPENYVGKTIKMQGEFAFYEDSQNETRHFACVIADATACCAQGLEFVPSDPSAYPGDYPEPNTEITILGNFETYEENGMQFCWITNAKLIDPTQ